MSDSMSETPGVINLKVVGTTGITYKILIENQNITIRELKEMISEKSAIPVNVFNLTYQGKNLVDNLKINDYSIVNNSVIHCIEFTEGGN